MYLHNNIGNILKLNLCDFVNYWELTLNVQIIESEGGCMVHGHSSEMPNMEPIFVREINFNHLNKLTTI